ncbi:hypothetical protein BKA01_008440 [Pseudonocardia eucalypti]|nr:hypothetical protein [Pseudonocardia eucalypti]
MTPTTSDTRATGILTGLLLLVTATFLSATPISSAPVVRTAEPVVGTCADAAIPDRFSCAGPFDSQYACELDRRNTRRQESLGCRRDRVHGGGKWFYGFR